MNKWPINSIKSLLSPLKIQNANCVYSEAWRLGTVQQSHSIWEQKLFITLVDLDLMLRSACFSATVQLQFHTEMQAVSVFSTTHL